MSDAEFDFDGMGADPDGATQKHGVKLDDEDFGVNGDKDAAPTKGYMDRDAWIAAGKDPEEWVSPEVFKERGIRIEETSKLRKQLSQVQQDTEARIANLNKLHRAQLEQERNKLLVARDNAIDIADKEEVRRIDKELDKNNELQAAVAEDPNAPQRPPEVVAWEAENPWIFEKTDPRRAPAIKAFAATQAAGLTLQDCIDAANLAAEKAMPKEPNLKRTPIASADNPKARQSSGGKVQLSMKDLTAEEKNFRSFYSSDAEFLKAVADSRG